MKIESLQMFCRVVERKSITETAKEAYLSQPAVTKQIRNLEMYYNAKLFNREHSKLVLTEPGRILYNYAKEIIAIERDAYESVQLYQNNVHQTLHIGASPTIGEYLLPSLIGKFRDEHFDVKFNLTISNTPNIINALEENRVDIALVESAFSQTQFKQQHFYKDKLSLVVSNEHPWKDRGEIELKEIIGERMIWRESESGMRQLLESFLVQEGILEQMDETIELGSVQAIKSAVEAGLGISILPSLTTEKEIEFRSLHTVQIRAFQITRDFMIVQKDRRFKKDIVRYFEKFLLNLNK